MMNISLADHESRLRVVGSVRYGDAMTDEHLCDTTPPEVDRLSHAPLIKCNVQVSCAQVEYTARRHVATCLASACP